MLTLLQLLISTLAIMLTAYILPGVSVKSFWNAFLVAIVLALLNTFVEPVMIILTIPITIFTMGLFLLVINAITILLASAIVPGFKVRGFWWAFVFSIILAVINYILESITYEGILYT